VNYPFKVTFSNKCSKFKK